MKIVFCIGSLGKGGAERVVANLSNYFIDKYDVTIIKTIKDENEYELNSKIKVFSLDKTKKICSNFVKRNIERAKTLINIIKKENPDIIISFLPDPTYTLMFANLFLNKKVIISVRNDPKIEYNTFIKRMLVKLLYTRADGFVFQTEDAKNWFSKKIQNKSTIIPNPINEKFIKDSYNGERKKEIVTVGRLNEQKNHKLLIEAFEKVVKKHSEYVLKIYGTGYLEEELKTYVKAKNLENNIKFMGQSDNVKDDIYKSGAFVLSSDFEGMPNALMEAMALGLPCVSTDCPCGGPKFLIKNKKNGILVPIKDANKLANGINYMIENPEKAKFMGIEANKITNDLNPKKINDRWEKYILEIKELNKK